MEKPGRNVAAKSGLNKAIHDQGWGMFRCLLEYKHAWRGGEVVAVNPRYTSQTCPLGQGVVKAQCGGTGAATGCHASPT